MKNKKITPIDKIPLDSDGKNLLFTDEDMPSIKLDNLNLIRSHFINLGLKGAKINDCKFHHCIFEGCYFRDAEFQNVNFTGSVFKECNFHKANFQGCCFWYVRFMRCEINYDEVLQSIPSEPSIAIILLRSLRQNALEMGEKKTADKILVREIENEEKELLARFLARSSYYKKRYRTLERFLALAKFISLKINGWFWGYGLRLWNLFLTAVVVIVFFAILICKGGSDAFLTNSGVTIGVSFWQSIYVSAVTFTSLGFSDISSKSTYTCILLSVESFLGVVFLGFLAAAVYRKFAR